MQYWVLDPEATKERREDWMSKLLSMDDAPSPSRTPKRGPLKKGKGKTKKGKAKAKAQIPETALDPQP